MSPRRTRAKDLRRRTAVRPERKTIVVFCEGLVSEHDYIKGLKSLPEIRGCTAIQIEIDPDQGVPLTLVQRARDRIRDDEVDECWCVFDAEPYMKRREAAVARAVALDKRHLKNGTSFPDDNPSSSMHEFLAAIEP
jgi:hypothetical protein